MKATKRRISSQEVQKLLSTRSGMIAVAGTVAVLAGAMLLFFLSQYRENLGSSGKAVTVLVASSLIEKGSPGDVIASDAMFETSTVRESQLEPGAIADPSELRGQVAADDIYPGEQLVAGDFTQTTEGVINKLSSSKRAISVPLDAAHGMIGDVRQGDHVDVLAGFNVQPDGSGRARPVLRTLLQDVLVLRAPAGGKTGGLSGAKTQEVVLRATDADSAKIAFSSDNGKVWIVLRPKAGAEQNKPAFETLETILFGVKTIQAKQRVRRGGRR